MKYVCNSPIFSRALDAVFWDGGFPGEKYHMEFKNLDGKTWIEIYEREPGDEPYKYAYIGKRK